MNAEEEVELRPRGDRGMVYTEDTMGVDEYGDNDDCSAYEQGSEEDDDDGYDWHWFQFTCHGKDELLFDTRLIYFEVVIE